MAFFAHAGHVHEITAATIPWWKDELTVSAVLILGFLLVLGVAHLCKASFTLKVVLAMAYMLVVGVACYSIAPILSIVALSLGIGVALVTTMLQLTHKK